MKKLIWVLVFTMGMAFAFDGQMEKEIKVKVKGDANTGVGLVIKSMSKEQMEKKDIASGALVLAVMDETSADEAGLMKDDIVIEANGQKVKDAEQLNDIAEALKKGDKLKLTVLRDGSKKSFTTEVREFKSNAVSLELDDDGDSHAFAVDMFDEDMDEDDNAFVKVVTEDDDEDGPHPFIWHSKENLKGGYLGVELDNLNDQLKEYFEVKNGALIEKVVKDSPAEKAGLKAGDVITKIGDKEIKDTRDVVRTVNYYDPEDEVEVEFVRKGDDKSVDVVLGKKQFPMGKKIFISKDDDDDDEDGMDRVNVMKMKMPKVPGMLKKIKEDFKIFII